MKINRSLGLVVLIAALLFAGSAEINAQTSKKSARKIERNMAGKKRKAPKEVKVKQPKAVTKAQKKQKKKADQRNKAYNKAIKNNKDRHFNIQSADVKERMKQNEKEIKLRDKERKKAERKKNRQKGSAKKKFKKR